MDEQKAQELRDAWDRVDSAIGKQERTIRTVTVTDSFGDKVPGQRIPMAHAVAGDVVALADSIPLTKLSKKAVELRQGCAAVEPDRRVMCQCACLHQLLEESRPHLPPAPAKAPEPAAHD